MNIKYHIGISLQQDIETFWLRKLQNLEEFKARHDTRALYKSVKKLMGTQNYNKGQNIIHNQQTITQPQEQADIFADTWEAIMQPNTPRDNYIIQNNVHNVRRWNRDNAQDILLFTDIDLNNLNHDCILSRPLKIHQAYTQLHKIKSLASGPSGIHPTILKSLPLKTYIHITRLYNATIVTFLKYSNMHTYT